MTLSPSVGNTLSPFITPDSLCRQVRDAALELLTLHFDKVVELDQFYKLHREHLCALLRSDRLGVGVGGAGGSSELALFNHVLRWVDIDRGDRSCDAEEIFQHIRCACVRVVWSSTSGMRACVRVVHPARHVSACLWGGGVWSSTSGECVCGDVCVWSSTSGECVCGDVCVWSSTSGECVCVWGGCGSPAHHVCKRVCVRVCTSTSSMRACAGRCVWPSTTLGACVLVPTHQVCVRD